MEEKMEEVSTSEARARFAELVNRVSYGTERIPITRHGRIVAVLVSADDLQILHAIDAREDAEDEAWLAGRDPEVVEFLRAKGIDPEKFERVRPLIAAG